MLFDIRSAASASTRRNKARARRSTYTRNCACCSTARNEKLRALNIHKVCFYRINNYISFPAPCALQSGYSELNDCAIKILNKHVTNSYGCKTTDKFILLFSLVPKAAALKYRHQLNSSIFTSELFVEIFNARCKSKPPHWRDSYHRAYILRN